jgi:hypothetical protein
MTTPWAEPLLTVPHVGVAEFQTAPTWLDNQDLVEGGDTAQQEAELYNQLLKASAWANNFAKQPLQAHTVYEQTRARVDRWGRMWLHPTNFPVRSVTGIAYGVDFENLTAVESISEQVFVESQRGLVITMVPFNGAWMGSLQFGPAAPPMAQVYVQYQYVAGYANTYLTENISSGVTSLPVADPTGFTPAMTTLWNTTVGGSIARIWDPANEEAVAVSASYTIGSSPVTLANATQNAHLENAQVSELPAEVRQAVVSYTVGLLLRQDTEEDMPFPGSPGPTARRSKSRGVAGGLISEAENLLKPYRRVR